MLPLPIRIKASIDKYVDEGCPTGGFLHAFLTNNLSETVARADEESILSLRSISLYLYNYTSCVCWGSPEKVRGWLKLHKDDPEEAKRIAAFGKKRRDEYEEGD